ncbi:MAG: signal peptidase I [Desulfuromonadales bacterium]|nr:signal peptidase I [Desulfuromonadales bacterium]
MARNKQRNGAGKKPWYREYAEALIVAAILALIIRTFVVQAFKIPSGSMEDTLLVGDHLLVNKFVYGMQIPFNDGRILPLRDPERGDIIVFEFPEDRDKSFFQRRDFIKRVIGTPGDVVEVREKKVFVNGELFAIPQEIHKEPEMLPVQVAPRDFMPPVTIPEGKYFVMGDNRDRSYDSRFWGLVDFADIKGLAFIKYWSWDRERFRPRWDRLGRPIH